MLIAEGLSRKLGDRTLWSDLEVRCAPGEVTVIRGPSGSGKTLLLRAMAWLDPLDAGAIALDGSAPGEMGAPAWRARVAYVAQRPAALPGTPAEFVDEARSYAGVAGRGWADPVPIAQEWRLPAEAWRRPWAELSGGERQRAALAICLARGPEYLLLDEPTSALDDEAVERVEADLLAHPAGLLWVTHDERQAERVGPTRIVQLQG